MLNKLVAAYSPQEAADADILAAQIKLWAFLGRRVRAAALDIHQPEARRYLQKLAEDLYPRMHAALPAGSLGGIFLTCP